MTTLCNATLTKAITTRINMKSAHKLAKLAMMAQAHENSGDLIYSDFLKYYLLNPIVSVADSSPIVSVADSSPIVSPSSSFKLPSKETITDVLTLILVYVATALMLCLPLATATGGLFTFDNILAGLVATGFLMGLPKLVVDYQYKTGLFSPKSNTIEAVA